MIASGAILASLLIGVIGLVWYRGRVWWGKPLLLLTGSAYAYWLICLVLFSVSGHTALLQDTPRVIEQWDLGWERLKQVNPRLVMCRMPAFGLDGPWRDRVGFAQTMEQLSGLSWVTGFRDGPPVMPNGPCDPLGGMHAAFAMLTALEQRETTGVGSMIEAPLVESALNLAAEEVLEFSAFGRIGERLGNRSRLLPVQSVASPPVRRHRCRGVLRLHGPAAPGPSAGRPHPPD